MLNAKRLMAIVLMLAMLLTMASFPVSADGASFQAPLTFVKAKSALANGQSSTKGPDKAIDGDDTTFFISDQYLSSQKNITMNLVFELPEVSTLDKLVIKWGGNNSTWGASGANKYNVCVSEDGETYTTILEYDNLYTDYASYGEKIEALKTGKDYFSINVTETGLNAENVKFIKIEVRNGIYRPTIREIEAYVMGEAADYTVEYVDEEGNPLKDAVASVGGVGATVTETAPAITGYKLIGEETVSIVLAKDAENKITFKYEKLPFVEYTVKYVDEEGKDIADSVVKSDYHTFTVTETALEVLGYKLIGEATASIVLDKNGTNEIVFKYETLPVIFYDVKYVDENGKEIAPTKTDIGVESVTETAKNIAGYICTSSATKELVLDANGTNVITFEYIAIPRKEAAKLALTGANISWPKRCTDEKVNPESLDALFDGAVEASSSKLGFVAGSDYGNTKNEITIDLGGLYNVDSLKLYWGNRLETWNLVPSGAYTISVAGADGVFGEPVYTFTDPGATATPMVVPANRERIDVVDIAGSADFVQYVKITSTNNYGRRLTIREIEVNAEEAVISSNAATVTVEHYDVDGNKIDSDIYTADNLGTVMNITPTEIAGYKYVGDANLTFTLDEHGKNYVVELEYVAIPNVVGVPAEEAYFATNSSNVPFIFSISTPTNASPADVFAAANWVVDNAEITSVNVTANDNPATLVFEWDIVVNVKPNDNTAFAVELDLPDTYELTDKVRFYREASDTLLDSAIAAGENKVTLDKTALTIEYDANGDITTKTTARSLYITIDVQTIIPSALPYMGYDEVVVEVTEIIANGDRSRINLKNFVRLGDQYVGNATINKTGLERFEVTVTLSGVNADGTKTPLKTAKLYSDIVDVAAKYPATKTEAQKIAGHFLPIDLIDQLFDQVHPFDLPTFTDAEWAFYAEVLVARGLDETSANMEINRLRTEIATRQEAAKDPAWVAPDYNEENVYVVGGKIKFKKVEIEDENGEKITVSKPAFIADVDDKGNPVKAFDVYDTAHFEKVQPFSSRSWNVLKDLHVDTFSVELRLLKADKETKENNGLWDSERAYVTFRKDIDYDNYTNFDAVTNFVLDMKFVGSGGMEYTSKNIHKHYNAVRRVLENDQLEPFIFRVDWYNWGKNPFKGGLITVVMPEHWVENYGAFDLVTYHMGTYKPGEDNDPKLTVMSEDVDLNLETREVTVDVTGGAAKLYDSYVVVPTDMLPSELPETIGVYYDIAE